MASPFFLQFTFFVLGVSSILGWNAVLTALDYFQAQFKDYNVAFLFPVPLFMGTCLIGLILPRISNYISLTFRVAYSLIFVCILLVILPLLAQFLPNKLGNAHRFWLSMVLIFFLGFFNSLQQNSCIGAASNLGGQYVGIFFIGTGMSGTIICTFRLICLASFGDDDLALGALVYFCVAGGWNVSSLVIYYMFKSTPEYRKIQDTVQDVAVSTFEDGSEVVSDSLVTGSFEGRHYEHAEEKMGVFKTLIWANQVAFPVPIAIFIIYVQTFTMFPGLALEKTFSPEFQTWGSTLLILTYNIADTAGKTVSNFRKYYSEKSQLVFLFLRFGFYVTFIFIVVGKIQNDWFPFVNLFAFAFLNGYTTGGFMQIGPEKVKEGWQKEKVGFVDGFSLVFGIMIGTFLAVPFSYIKINN